MEVIWELSAVQSMHKVFVWYKDYMGIDAAEKFRKSILKITVHLASNPLMGVLDSELSSHGRDVRGVVSHRRYKVIYYIKDDVLRIQYIWCCKRSKKSLFGLTNKNEK